MLMRFSANPLLDCVPIPRQDAFTRFLPQCVLALAIVAMSSSESVAGGSGLNTIVVVNQQSPDSLALGNYYVEKRQIPPENILRINWIGGLIAWSEAQYATTLQAPLEAHVAAAGLNNQIDYVVLSMGIPFQIASPSATNSTTSALFYGIKTNSNGTPEPGITNSYAASEQMFSNARLASAPVGSRSFLATMLTGSTLAEAMQLVNQGTAADASFPAQPVILAKTADPDRNIRHPYFDNAIFNNRVLGKASVVRSNSSAFPNQTPLLGSATGLKWFEIPAGTFVPGAIADNVTSFGGVIFGPNDQTSLFAFIAAGAAGSYGTVTEPGSIARKFPDPQVYFYQARGFNIAESYYQSLSQPHLGLVVAEPLATPFAHAGSGRWESGISNSILTQTTSLAVQFKAANSTQPLQQIDLFLDGKYFVTVTNLPPRPQDTLHLKLNGYPIDYIVPTNATLATVAQGIATLVNTAAVTNAVKMIAAVRGDRLEFLSTVTNHNSFPFFTTPASPGAEHNVFRFDYLSDSFPPRLLVDPMGSGGGFQFQMETPTALHYVIQASTNLTHWTPLFTNVTAGLQQYRDLESTKFSRRFYRVACPPANHTPTISISAQPTGATLHITSQPGQPCAILNSSNLIHWSGLATNQAGGTFDFPMPWNSGSSGAGFFRAWHVPPAPPITAMVTNVSGNQLLQIDDAAQPYCVASSTNAQDWTPILTNFAFREIQAVASSSGPGSSTPQTFVHFSQPAFLHSEARGMQDYTVLNSSLAVGAWLQFAITKTNGQTIVIGVTNTTAGLASSNLAQQIYTLINGHPDLQGPDGLIAEDYNVSATGDGKFNLYARSGGYPAANLGVRAYRSGLNILPSSWRTLTKNLADLQPRNHLYVTAGAMELNASFPLDTTQLADGYHELTAVAYEGSHVHTQTHATIPICVSNSPLSATLTLLDLTNNAPANATYHVQVSANTNNVTLTTLYSTGGAIGFATNNSIATFDVIGTNLWTGRHPFYAIVETATGQKFRTQTHWIRLQ